MHRLNHTCEDSASRRRRAREMRRRVFPALLLLAVGFAAAAVAEARSATGAVITFRKVFKSSSPEFTEIHIPESGGAVCDQRNLDEEPSPQPMEIGNALRIRIFALAADLHNFKGVSLDIKRRIANLGEKTFRYEKGSEVNEVSFNYTLNAKAGELLRIFEGLTREQDDMAILQRRMKYDRLGVNEALVQLDDDVKRQAVAQPERFLPLLEQIAGDPKFLEIARQRARALADTIRSGGAGR